MATLRFSAANDEVRFDLPAAVDLTGAFTFAILVMPRVTGVWQALIGHHNSGGTVALGTERSAGNRLEVDSGSGATSRTSTTTITTTNKWWLLAVTKAAGTATPRAHLKNITDGSAWVHEAMSGTMGNPSSASGGTIRVGEWADSDDLDGNVAVIGAWAAALADSGAGSVEDLAANLKTSDWTTHSTLPKYVHELTSNTSIPDLMGNGATLNVVNGTTIDTGNDPPGWTFDGAGSSGVGVFVPRGSFGPARRGPWAMPRGRIERRQPASAAAPTASGSSSVRAGANAASTAFKGGRASSAITAAANVTSIGRKAASALSTIRAGLSVVSTGRKGASSASTATTGAQVTSAGRKGAISASIVSAGAFVASLGRKAAAAISAIAGGLRVNSTGVAGTPPPAKSGSSTVSAGALARSTGTKATRSLSTASAGRRSPGSPRA
jgi:hypothetical protein